MPSRQRIQIVVGLTMAALFLFANAGFQGWLRHAREKQRLEKTLASLHSEHDRLSGQWALIQQDRSYTEYLIRKTLGYVKKGEFEYRFLPAAHAARRSEK